MILEKHPTILTKTWLFLLVISFLVLLTACGGGTATTNTPTPTAVPTSAPTVAPTTAPTTAPTVAPTTAPTSGGNSIAISNFAFAPASLTVKVGTKVTWTNNDSTTHTVTEDHGAFDSGNLPTGQSYSFTFSKAGTYSYHCSIHSSMVATIVVQ